MADYLRILQSSVNYMEQRLLQEIELEDIAERVGLSLFHFMRVFAGFTGYTLKGYIRQRRLSEAARELLEGDAYIYDLAEKYGFTSVEAFIRAFKKQFKLTPQEYRKQNQLIYYIPKMRVQICLPDQGGYMVKYQIKEMPPLTVIGRKQKVRSSETSETIDRMIAEFRELNQKNNYSNDETIVGICFHDPRFFDQQPAPEDEWWYMVGYLAKNEDIVPEGLEKYQVSAQRYAVFTHSGNLSNLGKTYRYICLDWISSVDHEFAPADELNFFDNRYDAEQADKSEYELFIPILK
ncbi:MAG: AraC family transcriptional regulator [Candidatus Stygibacter frigidus]|nr:AraC family transcriptional regulator [Candidatus Stygibacter frigidus]